MFLWRKKKNISLNVLLFYNYDYTEIEAISLSITYCSEAERHFFPQYDINLNQFLKWSLRAENSIFQTLILNLSYQV